MSGNLHEYFNKTTALHSAIGGLSAWHKMVANPFLDSYAKPKYPQAALGGIVDQMFRSPSHFHSETALSSFMKEDKVRTIIGNSKL